MFDNNNSYCKLIDLEHDCVIDINISYIWYKIHHYTKMSQFDRSTYFLTIFSIWIMLISKTISKIHMNLFS